MTATSTMTTPSQPRPALMARAELIHGFVGLLGRVATVALGGRSIWLGWLAGVVLGAILLTALPEALRYVGPLQNQWFGRVFIDPSDLRMLLFGLALVLMMLFRPAGLWPSKVRRRELST